MIGSELEQAAEEVQPQATSERASAQGVGHVLVYFCFIAGQPVHFSPHRPEAAIERAEPEGIDQPTIATLAQPP